MGVTDVEEDEIAPFGAKVAQVAPAQSQDFGGVEEPMDPIPLAPCGERLGQLVGGRVDLVDRQ